MYIFVSFSYYLRSLSGTRLWSPVKEGMVRSTCSVSLFSLKYPVLPKIYCHFEHLSANWGGHLSRVNLYYSWSWILHVMEYSLSAGGCNTLPVFPIAYLSVISHCLSSAFLLLQVTETHITFNISLFKNLSQFLTLHLSKNVSF